ncbi:RWD domain-containing protein 2A isoform X2 [Nomia melanderi]|uniref:RWD domain-containing protein 2A isoform X2 n=1 Tax=Nomia melanderi TaxID=2448451 RepID=UPI003FCDCE79
MSIYKEISENFMAQIYELEALQSVYPKELRITDHGVLADINNFIKSPTEELPQRLEYSIDLPLNGMNDGTIELLVSLSNNYPKEKPEIIKKRVNHTSTRFSMAGKPGVICVEGAYEDCEYYWQKIKSMNWQKIVIRLLERQEDCQNIDSMRQFNDIKEIAFPTSERHNDLGQLLKYLTDLNLQHAFKELFGLEGKVSEIPDL